MARNTWDDGLDYSKPDQITDGEIEAFREHYKFSKGYSIPALEFWLNFRPDILKRYRGTVPTFTTSLEPPCLVKNSLAMLHYYAIVGYEDGIRYEINLSMKRGATKGEILDTLAVAFIHGGPLGSRFVASSSTDVLEAWQDPPPQDRWPSSWSFDPEAFRSGMDFSTPDATKEDIGRLFAWYERTAGEIPGYVRFLAEFRPRTIKAYRNRFENVLRGGLPKQMLPYLLLHLSIMRGRTDGIREYVLLGKHTGMTREQLLDCFSWASVYGGMEALNTAEAAAGDILRQMD